MLPLVYSHNVVTKAGSAKCSLCLLLAEKQVAGYAGMSNNFSQAVWAGCLGCGWLRRIMASLLHRQEEVQWTAQQLTWLPS